MGNHLSDERFDRVRYMTRQQAAQVFERYRFRDKLGHDLMGYADFKSLLDMAYSSNLPCIVISTSSILAGRAPCRK